MALGVLHAVARGGDVGPPLERDGNGAVRGFLGVPVLARGAVGRFRREKTGNQRFELLHVAFARFHRGVGREPEPRLEGVERRFVVLARGRPPRPRRQFALVGLVEGGLRHPARVGHAARAPRGKDDAAVVGVLVLARAQGEEEREVGAADFHDERALALLEGADGVDEVALGLREGFPPDETAGPAQQRDRDARVGDGAPRRLAVAVEHAGEVEGERGVGRNSVFERFRRAGLRSLVVGGNAGAVRPPLRFGGAGERAEERRVEFPAFEVERERAREELFLGGPEVRGVRGRDPDRILEPDFPRVRAARTDRGVRAVPARQEPVAGAPVAVRRKVADAERRRIEHREVLPQEQAPP